MKLYRITFIFRDNICGPDFPPDAFGPQTLEAELNENDYIRDAYVYLDRKYPGVVRQIISIEEVK